MCIKTQKNASINYISFELNCRYYPQVLYKDKISGRFKSKLANNNDGRKYKIEIIWDSMVYAKESKLSYLLKLYYLIF